jgi:hypothetical protein
MAATAAENLPVIAPADAFRALLRARYPTRPELADEIGPVYPWFHNREKIYLQGCPENADDPEWVAARQLLAELKDKICAGGIRAYGSLDHAKPDAIAPNELAIGELDFDEKTLKCDSDNRIYRDVFLNKGDVDILIRPDGAPANDLVPKPTDGKSVRKQNKRGRKRKADQDAAEDALRDEIKRRGWPDIDNADPNWRHQTHVEEWLSEFFSARKEAIGESRTREIAVYLLNKLKADN